ncbi:hypothetical protein HQ560_00095, partial [bacterium]|nr:hypothetical protein [bacterium]
MQWLRARVTVPVLAAVLLLAGCVPPEGAGGKKDNLPDPKTESRMPWEPNAGGYLKTWLVCGEFPNPPHEGGKEYDHT